MEIVSNKCFIKIGAELAKMISKPSENFGSYIHKCDILKMEQLRALNELKEALFV